MPHDQCPPSRRGHSWRELRFDELTRRSIATPKIALTLRICKRCGARGRVSDQGVIHVVESP